MNTINILSALLTPVIAVVTTYIMIQQYRLEKRNYSFQLSEERHIIYTSVMNFISKVVQDANASREDIGKFIRETKDVNIFFEEEVSDYIDTLYKKAIELNHCNKMIESGKLESKKHKEYCDKDFEISLWFNDQFKDAKNIFLDYLNFKTK